MRIGSTDIYIQKGRDGYYWAGSKAYGVEWDRVTDVTTAHKVGDLYTKMVRRDTPDSVLVDTFCQIFNKTTTTITEDGQKQTVPAVDLKLLAQKMIDFFSEFHFEPNFRFMNTLAFCVTKSQMKSYINNYFTLIDSPFTSSISEKMKSAEFDGIVSDLQKINPTKTINKRFELYYGSQGTGKTTQAMQKASKCMVCHSAMLPQDLMEDFDFTDGKAGFHPSVLYKAMIDGTVIVLDEINLLPFESLRFLQSILDGKEEITYKGQVIKIADGFKIIGTMNLIVNGAVFSLPEPLIDRACVLKEFKLSASDLMAAFA